MKLIKLLILFMLVARGTMFVLVDDGSSSGRWSRFPRAADIEFADSLKKMQMVARITNGIYLKQGLIKGTIPQDELVSDVFHLGSITPSEVYQIDTKALEMVLGNVENLLTLLKVTNGTDKIEERLLLLRSIVDLSNGVETLENVENSFKVDVDAIEKVNVNWEYVETYANSLNKLLTFTAELEAKDVDKISDVRIDELLGFFKSGPGSFKPKVLKTVSTLPNFDNVKKTAKTFTTYFTLYDSMLEYSTKINSLEYKSSTDDDDIKLVESNFEKMGHMVEKIKNSIKNFNTLQHIFGSQGYESGSRTLKHTPAFPNGSSEFNSISGDFSDPWIQQVIGSEHQQLAAAVSDLVKLEEFSQDVTNRNSKLISEIFRRIMEVSEMKVSFKSLASNLTKIIDSNKTPQFVPIIWNKYVVLFDSISSLFRQLKAVDKIVEVSKVLGADLNTQLGKLKTVAEDVNAEDKTILINIKNSESFKSISDKLKQFSLLKSEMEGILEALKTRDPADLTVTPVIDSATAILNVKKDGLKDFRQDSTKYLEVLSTLRGIKEFESIRPVVKMRTKLSQLTQNRKIAFSSITKNVENLKKQMKAMESWIGKMKGFESVETNVLLQLVDVKKDSDTLGSATRGITNMKRFGEEKVETSEIKTVLDIVETIVNAKRVKLTTDEAASLNGLKTLKQDYDSLNLAVLKYIGDVEKSKSYKLVDHLDIFTKASAIRGIQTDFSIMRSSIEKLADVAEPRYQKTLISFIPTIDQLDSLGLDFSKHQAAFTSAKDSLSSMDLTFAKFEQLLTLTTTSATITKSPSGTQSKPSNPRGQFVTPDSPAGPGSQSASGVEVTTKAPIGWTIPIIIFVIFLLIAAVVVTVCYCCCCKKHEGDKPASSTGGSISPGTPVQHSLVDETSTPGPEPVEQSLAKNNNSQNQKKPLEIPSSVSKSGEKEVNTQPTKEVKKSEKLNKSTKAKSKEQSVNETPEPKTPLENPSSVSTPKPSESNNDREAEGNPTTPIEAPTTPIEAPTRPIEAPTRPIEAPALPVPPLEIVLPLIRKLKETVINHESYSSQGKCDSVFYSIFQAERLKIEQLKIDNKSTVTRVYSENNDRIYIDVNKTNSTFNWNTFKHPFLSYDEDLFYRTLIKRGIKQVLQFGTNNGYTYKSVFDSGTVGDSDFTKSCSKVDTSDTYEYITYNIRFTGMKEPHKVEHIWYKAYDENRVPPDYKTWLGVWEQFSGVPNLGFVSSTAQSQCFVFIELSYRELCNMKEVPSDPEWATNFTSSMLRKLKNDYPDAFQEKERDNTAFYVFAVLCFYYQICKPHMNDTEVKEFVENILKRHQVFHDSSDVTGKMRLNKNEGEDEKGQVDDEEKKTSGKNPTRGGQKKTARKSVEKKTGKGRSKVKRKRSSDKKKGNK